jgi:MoaA/NifB/PqqE/SkfB family radical SAM enzyme
MEFSNVKQVHFEPTQGCNASCPMCDRNQNGGPVNHHLTNATWTYQEFTNSFDPDFIKRINFFYSCGNHGDPIICEDLLRIYRWMKHINPGLRILTTTNGGARNDKWWEELAEYSEVNFSVDGLADTNHLYRQGVKWQTVENNMSAFCEAGGFAKWTFLVFRHNEHQVEDARRWSQALGVKDFIVKKSGRYINTQSLKTKDGHQAVNKKGETKQYLEQPIDPKYQNKALPQYKVLEERYGTFEKYLEVCKIDCRAEDKKEIYVSAEGFTFPCCWLAGQPYKWWRKQKEGDVHDLIGDYDLINVKKTPLRQIVNGEFFDRVQESWTGDRLKTCALKCNSGQDSYDPFSAQWK